MLSKILLLGFGSWDTSVHEVARRATVNLRVIMLCGTKRIHNESRNGGVFWVRNGMVM